MAAGVSRQGVAQRRRVGRVRARAIGIVALLGVLLIGAVLWQVHGSAAGVPPNYRPRDAALRAAPLRFYHAAHPWALVWFIGNDIGFWGAQQRLAASLAERGADVVGVDVRAWFAARPRESAEQRAAAFRRGMHDLMARSRRELGDTSVPLVIAGHSVGAEVALWLAAADPPAGLRGVVAISPGSRGHLRISASDLAFGEPTEPGSFAVDSVLHAIPAAVRVALVRGANDRLRSVDSMLVAARPALRHVMIPLAAHSMKRLFIAGPMIAEAVDWAAGR